MSVKALFTPVRHGNYHVYLNGRLFVGPDWRIMVVGVVLIISGSLLFVCFTNTIVAARVIVGLSSVATTAALLICGLSDPGIKPRCDPPPSPDNTGHHPVWRERTYVDGDGVAHHIRVEAKWCYSCNIYRPYRGVHCRYCDVCVTRRDHHCPWTGTCVGARNYRSYFALVWLLSILLVAAFVGGIQSLVQRSLRFGEINAAVEGMPSGFTTALIDTYCIELLLILLSFVFGVLAVSLALHHTYLVTQNLTSADVARDLSENMFTYGSVMANVWVVLSGCREEECSHLRTEIVVEDVTDALDADEASIAAVASPTARSALCADTGYADEAETVVT